MKPDDAVGIDGDRVWCRETARAEELGEVEANVFEVLRVAEVIVEPPSSAERFVWTGRVGKGRFDRRVGEGPVFGDRAASHVVAAFLGIFVMGESE